MKRKTFPPESYITILQYLATVFMGLTRLFSRTDYKLALKSALYDFTSTRDFYRDACISASIPMYSSLLHTYITLQALLITPIAPHWADYIWTEVLQNTDPSTIQNALFPSRPVPNPTLTAALAYIRATSSAITSAEAAAVRKLSKGKNVSFDPKKDKKLTIYYASTFPAWQEKYIELTRSAFNALDLSFDDKAVSSHIPNAEKKKAVPFVQGLKKRLVAGEERESVFERKLPFEEVEVVEQMIPGLRKNTGCRVVEVVEVVDAAEGKKKGIVRIGENMGEVRDGLAPQAEGAVPGQPGFGFENI